VNPVRGFNRKKKLRIAGGEMSVRIATFNLENLFARYDFAKTPDPTQPDGCTINPAAFIAFGEVDRQITAQVIREVNADILGLQEVESLPALDAFSARYLPMMGYKHRILIDGFDPRRINVALLSRYPIMGVRSYRNERNKAGTGYLFSRDCLEAAIEVGGSLLVLYVNHFKSMIEGRAATHARRKEQADRVALIVRDRWGAARYEGNFIVLGDLNDYPDGRTAIGTLLEHPGLQNGVDRLPDGERWTHYYPGRNEYKQLDYLLLSKSLAAANSGNPGILRKGMPFRAELYTGDRFPWVGEDNPKASDHAPVYMDVELK
jgi:endonuclease/exonuclease/phosphatase family metal-dependent hydrolase